MTVNRIETLTMIDDHHITVAREMAGMNDTTPFDGSDGVASQRCLDIDAFAQNFGGELRMPEFAEGRAHATADWPLQTTAHGIQADTRRQRRRRFVRPPAGASGHPIEHTGQALCRRLHLAQTLRAGRRFAPQTGQNDFSFSELLTYCILRSIQRLFLAIQSSDSFT